MNEENGYIDPVRLFQPQMNKEFEESLAHMSFFLWERESMARNELLLTIAKLKKPSPIEEREVAFWKEMQDGFRRFRDLHLFSVKKLYNLDAS